MFITFIYKPSSQMTLWKVEGNAITWYWLPLVTPHKVVITSGHPHKVVINLVTPHTAVITFTKGRLVPCLVKIGLKSFERSSVYILLLSHYLLWEKGMVLYLTKSESLYTLARFAKFDWYFPNGYGDVEKSEKFADILRTTGDQKISLYHKPLSKNI